MDPAALPDIQANILDRLRSGLPAYLTYHHAGHTLDVVTTALDLARQEGIGEADARLLHLAALYHDTGFLETYTGHEEVSCAIARQELPGYGLESGQIAVICGLIMATKVPQRPQTKLEEIICDADLDYLGRDDFFPIADSLYRELRSLNRVDSVDAWNQLQVSFLENHRYFTPTSNRRRQEGKCRHLEAIRQQLR